jgi:hypothetical protein
MITSLARVLLAASLLGSAWVHFDLWRDGFKDIETIGPLFLVNVIAGVILAGAVLAWRHWLPSLGAVGFGAVTLAAYVISVTVGLFGVQEQFRSQSEVWGVITEAACVVLGVFLLAFQRGRSSRITSRSAG